MRRPSHILALAGATLVVVATAAVGLAADVTPSLTDGPARFPDRSYLLVLPDEQSLRAGGIAVTENGRLVDGVSVSAPGEAGFSTILAIDASNSMRGEAIDEAMRAARAFAAKRNAATQLGVVFFNDGVVTALPLTRSQAEIDAVLSKAPKLAEGTRLYDAVDVAARQLSGARAGSIVVLTDGADVRSSGTLDSAVAALKDTSVRAFTVGLPSRVFEPIPLEEIAAKSGGTYTEATSAGSLTPIFAEIGLKLSNEYLITYRSLAGPEESIAVAVRVPGYPDPLTASYTTPALVVGDGTFNESAFDKLIRAWPTMLMVVAAIIALLVYGVRKVATSGRSKRLDARLAAYSDVGGTHTGQTQSFSPDDPRAIKLDAARGMESRLEELGRSLETRGMVKRFAEQCDIGRIATSPSLLFFGSIAGGLFVALVLGVLWTPVAALLGILVPVGTHMYVQQRVRQTKKAFGEQLPDNLDVLAGALRAGHSLPRGFAMMADDASEPSRSEFRRVAADEQLGVPLEIALKRVGMRMDNVDMTQVALIALLQRETGASSAEVIDAVTANVRGRMDVRRLVRTLTAQGRMARWIVSFLPLALMFGILVIFPRYLDPMFETTIGIAALVFGAMLVVAGSLVIKKIVAIKV